MKQRITVLLCCNSTGTDKRRLLIIGKSAKPRCFRNFSPHFYCTYTSNSKAWMTSSIFQEWLLQFNKQLVSEGRHPTVIHFLPPNITASLQPLDSGIIKSFKAQYRKLQFQKIVELADAHLPTELRLDYAVRYCKMAWDSEAEMKLTDDNFLVSTVTAKEELGKDDDATVTQRLPSLREARTAAETVRNMETQLEQWRRRAEQWKSGLLETVHKALQDRDAALSRLAQLDGANGNTTGTATKRDEKVIGFGFHSGEEIIDIPEEYQSPEHHERTFKYGKKPMAFYLKKNSNRFFGVPPSLIQWYADREFDKLKLIEQDMQDEETDLADEDKELSDSTIESLIRTMADQQRLMTDFLLKNKSEIRVGRPVKMDVATFDGRNADPKIWIKVYENICGNNGWVGDEARINGMRSYLTGSALLWFDNKFQDEEEYCWKDWKQEFICSFNENPIVSYDRAFNWRYRGGSLVEYFYQKQRKMQLGMPGLSEELLIIGIIHGLPQYMQEQLAMANIKCKQNLLKLLENIRPISEKNYSESRPSARTLGTQSRNQFILLNLVTRGYSRRRMIEMFRSCQKTDDKFTATEAINLVLEAGEQSIEIQAIVLQVMPFDLLIGKPTLKSLKLKWDFFTDQISFFSETGPDLVTRRDVEAKYPSLCKRTFPIISKFEVDFGLQENFRIISTKPYQLENTKRNWLNMKIRSMLSEGIIKPSNSAFASLCIVIPKKNGDYRLCVDYRKINDETLLDPFPFPRIEDIINVFGGCRFFSKLDLKDGFWQLGISENTRKYTAFVTPSGHYEFSKLPFGWKNSPAKFQRIMTTILEDLLNEKVVAYIDDICCGGYTQEDCSILTHKILERLNTAGLVLNLDKCQFCVPRIDLLGRVIDGDTKKIRSEVTEKVRNMKRPYNLRSLQCFTGLTNHFRAFIKDYAHIVRPLDILKGKDVTFEWDSECETAYQKLIALITEEPILRVPDGRLPFELSTDASYYGTGAILYQRDLQEKRCKQLRVIGYYSYTFTKAEQNYSVTEKECLAVLKAVKHFRSYLESRPFVVHTDHRALTQLLSCGELRDRLARWQLFLRSFNIIINHWSGKELRDADALSRLCVSVPDKSNEQTFWLKHKALELKYDEQRKSYLVTPEQVPSILNLYHDDPKSGDHSGFWRTYYTIKNRFWWRNMKGDIRRYVQLCSTCQKVKAKYRSTSDQMILPIQSHVPFHTVHVDFTELKKKSESNASTQSFLVVIDEATRIVYAKCMKQSGKALKEYFTDHPVLKNVKKIISDRGTSFTQGEFYNWTQEKGIRFLHTSPYHPAGNGLAERVIQEIKTFMECYPQFPKGWKCFLEAAVNYHNRHHNTYLGCSPWYKWKGTVPIVPADEELGLQLLRIEMENNDKQRHKYRLRTKYYYNRNRRRPTDIKPGDSILVKHQYTGKQRLQTGPHVVTDVKMVDGYVKYVLYESERGTQSAHITNINKFHHRPPGVPSQE
ncbi:K02A2.6-like [Cordylochernes scorpioides]|uniref:RNA-directed DNA polymerase n=1 Tax=Cordylochernes scorpioides TaxID=51811 RepID=A0ABY6L6L6_9ARAC|nr:K02A2.6-like [Cordylochernes scorpioides]